LIDKLLSNHIITEKEHLRLYKIYERVFGILGGPYPVPFYCPTDEECEFHMTSNEINFIKKIRRKVNNYMACKKGSKKKKK
jgi:hypothetical protein